MITSYCIIRRHRLRRQQAEQQKSQTRRGYYMDETNQHSKSLTSLVSDASSSGTYELSGDPVIYELSDENVSKAPICNPDTQALPELHSDTSLTPQETRQVYRIPSPASYNTQNYNFPSVSTPEKTTVRTATIFITPPTPIDIQKKVPYQSVARGPVVQDCKLPRNLRRSNGRLFRSSDRPQSNSPDASIVLHRSHDGDECQDFGRGYHRGYHLNYEA